MGYPSNFIKARKPSKPKTYRRFKKVKYKITDTFGVREIGDVIDSYVLAKDVNSGITLLLHPAAPGECASIELAKETSKGMYTSFDTNTYVNISAKDIRRLKF
jgi:hypothetical protein